MTQVNLAAARANLSALVDRAMRGEDVVIAKYGKPVVELRAVQPIAPKKSPREWVEWMGERRTSLPTMALTSVELLNAIYDDEPE